MSQALSKTNNIRVALTRSSVCQNYGINVTRDEYVTSKYVGHNLVNFYTTLFGASRIVALCNVLAIEQVIKENSTLLKLRLTSGERVQSFLSQVIKIFIT